MNSRKILRKIRIRNAVNLIFPGILLTLITIFYINSSIRDILKPLPTDNLSGIRNAYSNDYHYIVMDVDTLYPAGIECFRNGKPVGHYYYTFENDYCYFFLLSDDHIKKYIPENTQDSVVLNNITVKARVLRNPKALSEIIERMAHELSWTYEGLSSSTSIYLISEPDYHYTKTLVIFNIVMVISIISLLYMLYSLLCICCPYFYKSVIPLRHFGKVKDQISTAEKELQEDILLNEGGFIITKSYLMDCSKYDFRIIPLDKIVWAYKFSSYHPSRPINHKITYTLCVYGQHNVSLISSYLPKTDADKVLDYLNENYPDILLGYNREHEQLAKKRMKP